MSTPTLPYLAALNDAMINTIQPEVAEGMPQQIAMCSGRILASMLAEAQALPELQAAALEHYQELLPELESLLGDDGDLQSLKSALADEGAYTEAEQAVQAIAGKLAAESAEESAACLKRLTAIEANLRTSLQQHMEALLGSAEAKTESPPVFDAGQLERLASYLHSVFPGDPLKIGQVRAIPGGFSKQTIFVGLEGNDTAPETVVIRLDKADSPVGTTVLDEYHLIKTLFEHGVAVPEPFALEASGDILGGAFLVVSRIEGSNAGDAMDVQAGSPELARGLAQATARLHSIPESAFSPETGGTGMSTRERMLADIEDFEGRWRATNMPSIALETAFGWLKKNIHLADGHRSLVHKDIGCHNFLCENGEVTAFVDWETAVLGNPAQDLGYLRKSVVQMGDWDLFMTTYADAGAAVPPPEQIDYYELWGFTWLHVIVSTAAAAFLAGLTDDIQLGYSGLYHNLRLKAQLNDAIARICF